MIEGLYTLGEYTGKFSITPLYFGEFVAHNIFKTTQNFVLKSIWSMIFFR